MKCHSSTEAAQQLEATGPHRSTSAPLSVLGGDSVCAPAETQDGPTWGNTSTGPAEPSCTTQPGSDLLIPHAPLATYPCCRRATQETPGLCLLKLIINLLNGHLEGDVKCNGTFTKILASHFPPILSQTLSCLLPLSQSTEKDVSCISKT